VTAAYVTVPGVTADEAEAQGLVVVEYVIAGANSVPVYGYYVDPAAPGVAPAKRKGAATSDAATGG
jgi:hypothetical protein